MSRFAPLPLVMAAPNGARRGKADHPALPVTAREIVADALACHAAGAEGVHLHMRDREGRHVLDAELYRAVIADLADAAPGLLVQATTEAAGRYDAEAQMALVRQLRPRAVSVALREILRAGRAEVAAFLAECADAGIAVQHILYEPEEAARLGPLLPAGDAPQLLFVLGSHDGGKPSDPAELDAFLAMARAQIAPGADWMACAFGRAETACLARALALGGKARVGFENNLLHEDGRTATDNAERVAVIAALAGAGAKGGRA